jgi:hypothetical protein
MTWKGALLVSVGLPDVVNNVVMDAMENIVKVIAAAGALFGEDVLKQSPLERTNQILNGPAPALGPIPTAPEGGGGLNTGATGAGEQYNGSVDAAQLTDEKLAEVLKQIFVSNQGAHDKVSAILTEIQNKQMQMGPEMGDPASVAAFGQFLGQKLAEIQKILNDAQVDAKTQAAILDALGDEYCNNGPDAPGAANNAGGDDGSGAGGESSGGGGDPSAGGIDGAGGAAGGPGAGQDQLMDPLAGMGLGGPMGSDPLATMAPALAGLGALPQTMGGLGGAPLDALGPALGALGGLANGGFTDRPAAETKPEDGFTDEPVSERGKPDKGDPGAPADEDPVGDSDGSKSAGTAPSDPRAAGHSAAEQAAPATAPASLSGDAARNVTLPDGRVVSAPDPQAAQVMRSVLSGTGVSDAFKEVGVELAPPGTPVTDPVDPNTMPPSSIGRFESREPVMAMGNGKIWMDGQLQPLRALGSSSDFLGWSKPPTTAIHPVAVPATAPSAPPAAT